MQLWSEKDQGRSEGYGGVVTSPPLLPIHCQELWFWLPDACAMSSLLQLHPPISPSWIPYWKRNKKSLTFFSKYLLPVIICLWVLVF